MEHFVGGLDPLPNKSDFETVTDVLDIFSKAKTSRDILASEFIQILPTETNDVNSPVLNFTVPKSVLPYYLKLSETYVSLELALRKQNTVTGVKTAVTMEDNVSILSFIPDTLWKVKNDNMVTGLQHR